MFSSKQECVNDGGKQFEHFRDWYVIDMFIIDMFV